MFYQECENLANEHPSLKRLIGQVDELLANGTSSSLYRPDLLHSSLDVDYTQISNVFELLHKKQLFDSEKYFICPNTTCEGIILCDDYLQSKKDEEDFECPHCFKILTRQPTSEIVAYRLSQSKINTKKLVDKKGLQGAIFIVHGHDTTMKDSVSVMLDELGLEYIILNDKPSKGMTLIEKIEHYSQQCSYAIVLLSPDDFAISKNDFLKDKDELQKLSIEKFVEKLRDRPRQNVIFELGYFIGRFGRGQVCPLLKKSNKFEIPSDYIGVVYTEYDDSGEWKNKIIDELKELGYNI